MQHLLELDTIKTRMMDSQNALQVHLYASSSSSSSSSSSYSFLLLSTAKEADNWTTLSADVDEVFASGDPDQVSCSYGNHAFDNLCLCLQISDKLIRMQQSLVSHTLSHSHPLLDSFCLSISLPECSP